MYLRTPYKILSTGRGLDATEYLDAPGRLKEAASRNRAVGEQDPDLRHGEEAHTRSYPYHYPYSNAQGFYSEVAMTK